VGGGKEGEGAALKEVSRPAAEWKGGEDRSGVTKIIKTGLLFLTPEKDRKIHKNTRKKGGDGRKGGNSESTARRKMWNTGAGAPQIPGRMPLLERKVPGYNT